MTDALRRAKRGIADARMLLDLVNAQAEDEGLWFVAQTAPEAYLQAALRKLHAAVEKTSKSDVPH